MIQMCAVNTTLGLLLIATSITAQSRCPQDTQPATDPRVFVISAQGISLPIGAILLLRRGKELGAIHITDVKKDFAAKPRLSEWIGSVSFESFYRRNNDAPLRMPDTQVRTGILDWGRFKGVGFHSSRQPGNKDAMIGPWRFHFYSQNLMGMSTFSNWSGDKRDHRFEFAPTSACRIDRVDFNDAHLQWYSDKLADKGIVLDLASLPAFDSAATDKEK